MSLVKDWLDIPEGALLLDVPPAISEAAEPRLRWKLAKAGGTFDATFRIEIKRGEHER